MYICNKCGNRKYFLEENCCETEVNLDEKTGDVLSTFDKHQECCEVVCGICKASSEDEAILDRDGNIVCFH